MKPVLALVGRANVGKSTLFNRLTKSRDAIVADFAGLTRDRHYGTGSQSGFEYIVIDTGGFEPDAVDDMYKEMAKQTQQAIAEAVGRISGPRTCACKDALATAMITRPEHVPAETKRELQPIIGKYIK